MYNDNLTNQLDRQILALLDQRAAGLRSPRRAQQMLQTVRTTLEQVDLCQEIFDTASTRLLEQHPIVPLDQLPQEAAVACQGVPGAYSHIACEGIFDRPNIQFYSEFAQVFQAVAGGQVEFGVLPVENSSAGQVSPVLDLVAGYACYIVATVQTKIEHCFCVHPDIDPAAIGSVISHPQALLQCRQFLQQHGLEPREYSNTAAAAKEVARTPQPLGCICSQRSAQLYGLRIVQQGIEDFSDNYTRFVCIARQNYLLPQADTVSVTVSFPNQAGALNKFLTRFAICDLDLSKILSMPIASRDFHVRFHLDFRGSIRDMDVVYFLSALYSEGYDFKYLGNHPHLQP